MEPRPSGDLGPAENGSSEPSSIEPASEASVEPRRSFWFDVQAWFRDLFLSVAIAAVVIIFLYQPVKVEGTSMMPQLADQQRIFVNKFLYRFDEIRRGDVIVFRFPLDPSKSYIKRVVGLPGDTVEIVAGQLVVNAEPVDEPYVPSRYRDRTNRPPTKVKPGHYYVLGDHRNTSNDSRSWGPVERSYITGKAVFGYWPLERFGVLQ